MPASLFAILARRSSKAVIFRRGPSKMVRLIAWDRRDDSFEHGQWFKGRIYERRCDLTPNGSHLIYFAADFKMPRGEKRTGGEAPQWMTKPRYYSWTAISKPPFLTALALWPKGDCWHGGGLFEKGWEIWLNHAPVKAKLAAGYRLMPRTIVKPNPNAYGEDEPVYWRRLRRDGWTLVQKAAWKGSGLMPGAGHGYDFRFDAPEIWSRPNPDSALRRLQLRMIQHGRFHTEGSVTDNYKVFFDILDGGSAVEIGECDWADWDKNGDLLFTRKGKLSRLSPRKADGAIIISPGEAREIADFNDMKFEPVAPPPEATRW